jgi:hypothetical protein
MSLHKKSLPDDRVVLPCSFKAEFGDHANRALPAKPARLPHPDITGRGRPFVAMKLSLALISGVCALMALQASSSVPKAHHKASLAMLLSYNGADKMLEPEAVQANDQAASDISVVGRTYRFLSRFVDITPARMHEPIEANSPAARGSAGEPTTISAPADAQSSLGNDGSRLLADLEAFRFREQRAQVRRVSRSAGLATSRAVKASVHAASEAAVAAKAASKAAVAAEHDAAVHDAVGAKRAARAASEAASAASVAAAAARDSRFAATSLAAAIKRAPWASAGGFRASGKSHAAAAEATATPGAATHSQTSDASDASPAADSSPNSASQGRASAITSMEMPAAAVVARSIARVR